MTDSFSSEYIEELIAAYILGNLDSHEAQELELLLSQNPEMVSEITRLQEVISLIPYELPQIEPPVEIRSKILAAIQTHQNPVLPLKRFSVPWGKVVAALLVLAFGLDSYRLRQELQDTQSQLSHQKEIIAILQQPNSRLVALAGVSSSKASGNIILDSNKQKLVIAVENLSQLRENQIYRLWAVVDHKKIACGQFNTNSTGRILDSLPLPTNLCAAKKAKLVVTTEPLPSPPQPVGSPVLIGKT